MMKNSRHRKGSSILVGGAIVVIGVHLLIAIVSACSSSSDSPPGNTSGSSGTSGTVDGAPTTPLVDGALPDGRVPRDPNANCVKPGTPNNDQGIGGYCEQIADCVKGKSTCSGAFGAPETAWFCTRPCDDDPDCGVGLYCAHDPRGIACVPFACGIADADAPDAAQDAPSSD